MSKMVLSAFVSTPSPTFSREFLGGLLKVYGWSLGFSWWHCLSVLPWSTGFSLVLTWKTKPFLRSGWIKKGGRDLYRNLLCELRKLWNGQSWCDLMVACRAGGCMQGITLPVPSFFTPTVTAQKDALCGYGFSSSSTLTFGPLSLVTELSSWHKYVSSRSAILALISVLEADVNAIL